jgi:hypothetical protein
VCSLCFNHLDALFADLLRFWDHLRCLCFGDNLGVAWVIDQRVRRLSFVCVRLVVGVAGLGLERHRHRFAELSVFQVLNRRDFRDPKPLVPLPLLHLFGPLVLHDFFNLSLEVYLNVFTFSVRLAWVVGVNHLEHFGLVLAWLLEEDVLTDGGLAVAWEHGQVGTVIFVVVVLDSEDHYNL